MMVNYLTEMNNTAPAMTTIDEHSSIMLTEEMVNIENNNINR